MVEATQYMNGTLESGRKTRYTRHFSNIFSFDERSRVSAMIENKNDVYGSTPDIAETSPRGHTAQTFGVVVPTHRTLGRRGGTQTARQKQKIK